MALDAYARALARYPRRDPRHRIEHFAVVQPRQVAQAAGLGVIGVPLLGIADMVLCRTATGKPFNPGEAITAHQAPRAYTFGSAYASHQEHVKGSITRASSPTW